MEVVIIGEAIERLRVRRLARRGRDRVGSLRKKTIISHGLLNLAYRGITYIVVFINRLIGRRSLLTMTARWRIVLDQPILCRLSVLFSMTPTGCMRYSPVTIFDEFIEILWGEMGQRRNIQAIEDCRLIRVDSTGPSLFQLRRCSHRRDGQQREEGPPQPRCLHYGKWNGVT